MISGTSTAVSEAQLCACHVPPGDKQGLPDYRSPKPTRSPSTQGYGRSRSHAEGATPRRRSLTPSASMKESLPPPPPSQSMLDSPAGQVTPCLAMMTLHSSA